MKRWKSCLGVCDDRRDMLRQVKATEWGASVVTAAKCCAAGMNCGGLLPLLSSAHYTKYCIRVPQCWWILIKPPRTKTSTSSIQPSISLGAFFGFEGFKPRAKLSFPSHALCFSFIECLYFVLLLVCSSDCSHAFGAVSFLYLPVLCVSHCKYMPQSNPNSHHYWSFLGNRILHCWVTTGCWRKFFGYF